MARPVWRGSISFGMVTIPVALHTAIDEKDVHFNMLHEKDKSRVRQKRFCEAEGVEIGGEEIVNGYEVDPGRYVVLSAEDLEALPLRTAKSVEIREFVDGREVDPVLHKKTYYLEPAQSGRKGFALLMAVLQRSGRVAVAQVVVNRKEQLCMLRPYGGTLALEMLFYADEVKPTSELELPSEDVVPSVAELEMAETMVSMMSSRAGFDVSKYRDSYREALLELIDSKAEGLPALMEAPQAAPVVDLSQALAESVKALKRSKSGNRRPRKVSASASEAA